MRSSCQRISRAVNRPRGSGGSLRVVLATPYSEGNLKVLLA